MEREKTDQFKKRLWKEKRTLLGRIDGINFGLDQSLRDSVGELSMYDNHPADLGDETFERSKDFSLRDNALLQLDQVNHALKKIAEDSYGICDRCGRPISQERLDAMPWAVLCIDCKHEEEVPDATPRPIEEEVIKPPFGEHDNDSDDRKFGDGDNDPGFDGEDSWQAVAQYGTSETPQDLGSESRAQYPHVYIDWDEDRGSVSDVDSIPYRRAKDGMIYQDFNPDGKKLNDVEGTD